MAERQLAYDRAVSDRIAKSQLPFATFNTGCEGTSFQLTCVEWSEDGTYIVLLMANLVRAYRWRDIMKWGPVDKWPAEIIWSKQHDAYVGATEMHITPSQVYVRTDACVSSTPLALHRVGKGGGSQAEVYPVLCASQTYKHVNAWHVRNRLVGCPHDRNVLQFRDSDGATRDLCALSINDDMHCCVKFSSSGDEIAVTYLNDTFNGRSGFSGRIDLCDVTDGTWTHIGVHPQTVKFMAWSSDNNVLVTASSQLVLFWVRQNGRGAWHCLDFRLPIQSWVRGVQLSPDRNYLAVLFAYCIDLRYIGDIFDVCAPVMAMDED